MRQEIQELQAHKDSLVLLVRVVNKDLKDNLEALEPQDQQVNNYCEMFFIGFVNCNFLCEFTREILLQETLDQLVQLEE